MTSRVCTCGASEAVVETEIVGLPESASLERIAKRAGFAFVDAVRFLRAIAGAAPEDADAVISWTVREQIRLLHVAKEKSDAKAAAIAAAERRAAGGR